jgi:hypothetical protein
MKQKTVALLTMGACIILAGTAVVLALSRGGGSQEKQPQAAQVIVTPAPAQTAEPETTQEQEGEKQGFFAGLFQKSTPTPEPTTQATTQPKATVAPVAEPIVTQRPSPVTTDYFDDAVFVGDSMVMGLDMYDYDEVLAGADFFTDEDMTIADVGDYVSQWETGAYGKIYVGVGIDELSLDQDVLRSQLEDMIDDLQAYDTGALIYLMSVTPISEYKSGTSSVYTQSLALAFNELLQELAQERNVYYLDVYSVLCNSDGYLPSDVTMDGIHFTPAHSSAWFEYIQTHYVGGTEQTAAAAETPVGETPAEES